MTVASDEQREVKKPGRPSKGDRVLLAGRVLMSTRLRVERIWKRAGAKHRGDWVVAAMVVALERPTAVRAALQEFYATGPEGTRKQIHGRAPVPVAVQVDQSWPRDGATCRDHWVAAAIEVGLSNPAAVRAALQEFYGRSGQLRLPHQADQHDYTKEALGRIA